LEIAVRPVVNPVAESPQFAGEFVIVRILSELSRSQELVILKRFPTLLDGIECRIEHDAMRVQVRIKGARCVVREQRRNEVSRQPIILCATCPDASRSKRLEFPQRRSYGTRMGFENPFVPAQESCDRNRLWR